MKIGQKVYWICSNVYSRGLNNCNIIAKDLNTEGKILSNYGLVELCIDSFCFKNNTIGIGFDDFYASFGIEISEINKTLFENKNQAKCKFNNIICIGSPISHENLSNK
jgi:hypothetical protein